MPTIETAEAVDLIDAYRERGAATLADFYRINATEIAALDKPLSREGLVLATELVWRLLGPDPQAFHLPINQPSIRRIARYIGEVYCAEADAYWDNAARSSRAAQTFVPIICAKPRLILDPKEEIFVTMLDHPAVRSPGADSRGTIVQRFDEVMQMRAEWKEFGWL